MVYKTWFNISLLLVSAIAIGRSNPTLTAVLLAAAVINGMSFLYEGQ